MSIRLSLIVCFVFPLTAAFFGCSAEQPPARPETPQKSLSEPTIDDRPKVIAFGDSLTSGFGLPKRSQAYPALLQNSLDNAGHRFQVLNYGYGGDTTERGLARLHLASGIKTSQIFVVELGANDIAKKVPVATMKSNLSSILSKLRDLNKAVLLCGFRSPPENGPEYAAAVDRMYVELSAEFGVKLMPDFMAGVTGNPEHLQADGIHPNGLGAKLIAENVFGELQPLIVQNEKK